MSLSCATPPGPDFQADHLILSVNRRLARALALDYAARRQAEGLLVWETPVILSWSAWLERCWQSLLADALDGAGAHLPALLSPVQEQALWERIIADSEQAEGLAQPAATARQARSAWQVVHAWRVELSPDDGQINQDVRAFRAWAAAFAELCAARDWLDAARLPEHLDAAWRAGRLGVPPVLWLAGFEELTPQQQALLHTLRELGCQVRAWDAPREDAVQAARVALPDTPAEIRAAACWARDLLETGQARHIGVVVPQLAGLRRHVLRIFDEVLDPPGRLPGNAPARPAYNLSLGRPLLDYPLAHSALLTLGLAQRGLSLEELGHWLRSPFLAGGETELTRRALLDARLRETGRPEWRVRDVLYYLPAEDTPDGARPYACSRLRAGLLALGEAARALPDKQPPSAWAESFSRLLDSLGWPRQGRALDSAEYQTAQAWRGLLLDLASLDPVWPALGFSRALSVLRRLAAERIFQPQSEEDAPVHILGELEAAGLRFDALWVLGLHDAAWPPPPRPNPFLPVALQRRLGLPRASAERELQVARRVTARLLRAAPTVLCSYPLREGERDLRPSPLLHALPARAADTLPGFPDYRRALFLARRLESLDDARGPPLPEGYSEGGSALFKHQAACPFRAFAQFRLGARALGAARRGLDPSARGLLVHRALEQVWREVQSHARLCALPDEDLRRVVAECVAGVVEDEARRQPRVFTARFRALEQARLEKLVRAWLEQEKGRAPFRVMNMEQAGYLHVSGIRVRIQPDRVDLLEDGGKVLIDYKTGQPANERRWAGPRPDEPQLPLYSIPFQTELAALVFAQVRPGQLGFRGLANAGGLVPGVKAVHEAEEGADWAGQLRAWQEVLARLGEQFRAGHAAVDPKNSQSCRFCALPALCRVAENGAPPDDAESEDDAGVE